MQQLYSKNDRKAETLENKILQAFLASVFVSLAFLTRKKLKLL